MQQIRGSDVFIAEDVLRMMRGLAAAHEATRHFGGQKTQQAEWYSAGFIDGLRALAETMGIHFNPGHGNISIGVRWDD